MKNNLLILVFTIPVFSCFAQIDMDRLGQTPGGAGFNVTWDSTAQQLIVGCGTSIWVYDCSDTSDYHVIAKKPLMGVINETDLYGDTLFVAATHDGIWALDYNAQELDPFAHYQILNDAGAYDMWRTNDTLYIATENNITILKYSNAGFTKIGQFSGLGSFCVSRRGEYIAVGSKGIPNGKVSVYHYTNLTTPVATWQDTLVWVLQDIQFADLRDDIIYLCGGPADLLFMKSYFLALQFDGSSITTLDTFMVDHGLPFYAQMNIQNIDSRNDTVFVATGAAFNLTSFPFTYMPVLDCSGLPGSGIDSIAWVAPGFWHFDPALMDGTPYIAMSSEWLGVLVSDVSQLNPTDTLGLLETGGWCVNTRIFGDTVWACHEGFGIAAYKLDSLYYTAGSWANSRLMHYFTQFVSDFDILGDTLLLLNTTEMLDLRPWFQGSAPVFSRELNINGLASVRFMETNAGLRILGGFSDLLSPPVQMKLYDPMDSLNSYPLLASEVVENNIMSMYVSHDTLFCGKKYGLDYYLAAYKVMNDAFVLIDTIKAPGEILGVSADGGKIGVACLASGFGWYSFDGSEFSELGTFFSWLVKAADIKLKNNLAYIADRFYGMRVYDISQATAAEMARGKGTMGLVNVFGSNAIELGPEGRIFTSDFAAGVVIYDIYDTSIVNRKPILAEDKRWKLQIYPNPAGEMLNIEIESEFNGPVLFTVYDLSGKKLKENSCTHKPGTETIHLDIRHLPEGVYVYQIRTSGGSESGLFEVVR